MEEEAFQATGGQVRWGEVSSPGGDGGHTNWLTVNPSSVQELCSEGVRLILG